MASHPEQRLKRVHGEEIADSQIEQRTERASTAQCNRPSASAQFTRDHPCDCNGGRACNRRKKTNRKNEFAEEDLAQPKQHDDNGG